MMQIVEDDTMSKNYQNKVIVTEEKQEKKIFKLVIIEETMTCSGKSHNKPFIGSKYERNKTPKYLFRRYPDDPDSPLYTTCLDCRNYDTTQARERRKKKQEIRDRENEGKEPRNILYVRCGSSYHTVERTGSHRDKAPRSLFLKDPNDPESALSKICRICTSYQRMSRREEKALKLEKRNIPSDSEIDMNEIFLPCLSTNHKITSKYDEMSVPYSLFLEDPEDVKSELKNKCLDCRIYSEKRKAEKIKLAESQGKFYCIQRGHMVDKLALNKDGTTSVLCEECKKRKK